MARSVKDFVSEANAVVPKLTPEEAAERMTSGDVLVVDVRDANEVEATGKLKGALNVSRGMLEFRADPESSYYNPEFRKDRTILLHCAAGGRSAMSGKVLKDMGYTDVYNIGGFTDLAACGIEVEKA
ncbi:rhodanese-like domain-containing protein [Chthonobacter rhizosphaerae]|uniref:rhodanese-like domain-containing protein n=1 Tax=Chthonobacter rhizosphaerae TaxID=2735553 RepID=UPI0015EF9FE5|nr:rhodanese-like domain-containing protein [Chthonobacter rhizosphaerae]